MPGGRDGLLPDSWLARLLGVLVSVALVALGFVLLTAALVVGGVLALAAVARLAWLRWSAERRERRGTIEVEYRVDPEGGSASPRDGSTRVLEGELVVDPQDEDGG